MRPSFRVSFWLALIIGGCGPSVVQQGPEAAVQVVASDSMARVKLAEVAREVPRAVLELRYATTQNFTGGVLPGYDAPVVLLRREAALALAKVSARVEAQGYRLKIWDGYRPVRATLAMVAWTERERRTDLLDDGYIARRSRHNQGVAVDLTLVRADDGTELDMGTPFDEFSSRAHTANATGIVAANRRILIDAMASAGFTNYTSEWWHFSFSVPDPLPFDLPLAEWRVREVR
ncbi:MAG: M15 family metallopeptidase [Gemmatimonadales bacterium]